MIDIKPTGIYHRKMRTEPQILISEIKGDPKSQVISGLVQALENQTETEYILTALRVDWDSFKNETQLPEDITPYTVFYLRNGETVGYINEPSNLNELKYFYKRCNQVSLYSFDVMESQSTSINENASNAANIVPQTNLQIPINHSIESKMKISSDTCAIFQFKKKSKKLRK